VRRLRTIDPIVPGGFEPGLVIGRSDSALANRGAGSGVSIPAESVACSGCGGPIGTDAVQEIVACEQCGTHTKIERQLEAEQEGEPAEYPEPVHRFGFMRSRCVARDVARDQAIRAVFDDLDLPRRVERVMELTPWECLTAEREVLLTRLLEVAPSHSLLDVEVCGLVHRFLQMGEQTGAGFRGHPWRFFVLRCATRVAFRRDASGRLIQELKYVRGGGAALKLLLDVADYALKTRQLDYAEDALEVVAATVTDFRNYRQRHVMYDVMAYRLAYVDERLVAYLLFEISTRWVALLEPKAMARLVDDCMLERPRLGPVIANEAAYLPCTSLSEYREHVRFVATLFTPLGRALGLESYIYTPGAAIASMDADTVRDFVRFLQSMRAVPESEVAATRILRWWVDDVMDHDPDRAPELVGSLEETLPGMPVWPPLPRETTYTQTLETIALSFRADVEQRSHHETDDPEPDDRVEKERYLALGEKVSSEESARRTRAIDQTWGAYRG
jgi:hypothetical protein